MAVNGNIIDIPQENIIKCSPGYKVLVSNSQYMAEDPPKEAKEIKPNMFDCSGYRYIRLALK